MPKALNKIEIRLAPSTARILENIMRQVEEEPQDFTDSGEDEVRDAANEVLAQLKPHKKAMDRA